MKKTNMKRKIALYMAIIMLFNLVVPFVPIARTEVMAAPSLSFDDAAGMAANSVMHYPLPVARGAATTLYDTDQHVYLTFPIPAVAAASYRLRFPLDNNGREVHVYINVSGAIAHVTYRMPPPYAGADPNFQVWSAPAEQRFIPIDEYIERTDRPTAPGNRVVGLPQERLNPVSPPAPAPPEWDPAGPDWPLAAGTPPGEWIELINEYANLPGAAFRTGTWYTGHGHNGHHAGRPETALWWPPSMTATSALIDDWNDVIFDWGQAGWSPFIHSHYIPLPGYPDRPPEFEISEGGGFSFRYHGNTTHIRFDSLFAGTRMFHFASDHFRPGFVYDVVLEQLNAAGAPVSSSGIFVNTGFDPTSIYIRPFANAVLPGGVTSDAYDRFNYAQDYINHRIGNDHTFYGTDYSNVQIAEGPEMWPEGTEYDRRWPAMPEEPLGFTIEFDTPIHLLLSGREYLPRHPLRTAIEFPGYFSFVIDNLLSPTPALAVQPTVAGALRSAAGFPSGIQVVNTSGAGITAQNRIAMDFLMRDPGAAPGENLFLPGTVITQSFMYLTQQSAMSGINALWGRETDIEYRVQEPGINFTTGPFTLLNYEIVLINGRHYVQILSPYTLMGQYVVLEAFIPDAAPGVVTLTTTPIHPANVTNIPPIPLTGDAFAAERYLQVFFRPGPSGFSDAELALVRNRRWPIRSQGVWYRGDENQISLRTSELFRVTLDPVIGHIPLEGDLERNRGIATLTLDWSIADAALLNHFFLNHIPPGQNHLDIYYEFHWSANPYLWEQGEGGDYPEKFVEIRTRITTGAGLAAPGIANIGVQHSIVNRDDAGNVIGYGNELLPDSAIRLTTHPALLGWTPQYDYFATIQLEVDTYHLMARPVIPPVGLNFPNIYFLNVRPVQVGSNRNFVTTPSQYDGFTLSDFEDYDVPPPQNLVAFNEMSLNALIPPDAEDRVSFDLSWDIHLAQIREYLRMTYGLLFGDNNRFYLDMNLYISENEELMRGEFVTTNQVAEENRNLRVDQGVGGNLPTGLPYTLQKRDRHIQRMDIVERTGTTIDGSDLEDEDFIFFSPIRQHTEVEDVREYLRDGGVVAVTGIRPTASTSTAVEWNRMLSPEVNDEDLDILTMSFTLDGLDRNQQYFVYAAFTITQVPVPAISIGTTPPAVTPPEGGIGVAPAQPVVRQIVDSSLLSNLVGITVPDDRDVPDGLDRDPMAPDLGVEHVGINYAIIYWDRIRDLPLREGYTEYLEYQVIRIRDNQMSSDPEELTVLLNNRAVFPDVWTALSSHVDIIGFQTVGATDGIATATPGAVQLTALDGRPTAPRIPELIGVIQSEPVYGMCPIRLLDQSLVSNTLYFYYVRTIRTVRGPSGEITTHSVWSHVSVTTGISGAPRNLRVELGNPEITIEYNAESEVVISFEAPVLFNMAALAESLGRDFIFEYQIRVDDEEWQDPRPIRSSFLLQSGNVAAGTEEGWTWFLYHITSGIEHGRMHTVRVRMVELDNGTRISESMWSNEANWIADGDPDEDEYDRREDDWRDYLRRRLEELLRNPYWVIRADAGAFQVIYRVGMFNQVLMEAVGGQIHLPFEDARQSTHYFPAGVFAEAWEQEMSFVLTNPYGNMQVMVPARAIDLHNNNVVVDVARSIRHNEFQDYLVRFNVNWNNPPYIQGEDTLTFVADWSAELVSVRYNIVQWERRLVDSLIDRVEEIAEDEETINFIREAVRNETPAEDISREMVRIVEIAARDALARVVRDNKRDLTARSRTSNVPRLDRSIVISVMAGMDPLAAIEAWQSPGGNLWSNVPTLDVNDSQGFFTTLPGIFVFTGRVVTIQGIEQVTGGPVATGVVARHGLDDFFGRDQMNVHAVATRSQLVNSVARMMGAPRGTDAVPWLRANGVTVTAAGMNNPISNQSALHLIMLVYEAQTGTRMDSLQITNFNVINNLPGLQNHYRTAVAAAVQLGIIDAANLQPTGQMTVGTMLEVLAQLDRLIGL